MKQFIIGVANIYDHKDKNSDMYHSFYFYTLKIILECWKWRYTGLNCIFKHHFLQTHQLSWAAISLFVQPVHIDYSAG